MKGWPDVAEAFRPPRVVAMPTTFRRKRNRLPLDAYRGARACSLTLNCARRRPAFAEGGVVESCIDILRSCSEKHGFEVVAYCFMPDHLHLLVVGGSGSDVLRFVKDFKQRTAYSYRRSNSAALWQKSYYDHVLRLEEEVRQVARYIVSNPVRGGLVEDVKDYPHSGSFVWGRAIVEA